MALNQLRTSWLLFLLAGFISAGCATIDVPAAPSPPLAGNPMPQAPSKPYLLHLPGISGPRHIDRNVTTGIHDGGFNGDIDIYDWTENDPGVGSLVAYERNHKEAKLIADKLTKHHAADPNARVILLAHSGGCGLAIWALEDLPPEIKIDTIVMMSPAVSPNYDLSAALKHVTGHLYVFSSLGDLFVLGTGTRLLGTIDGVKTDAAGRVGFNQPPRADAAQYAKLIPMPYDTAWFKYNDYGDHIGGMTHAFGEHVLEPLIVDGRLPATSMPTTVQTPTGLGREIPR